MASSDTKRQRKRTEKTQYFRFFGIKVNQTELIIVACCVLFIGIAGIGILLSGKTKEAEEPIEKTGEQIPISDADKDPLPEPFQLAQTTLSLEAGAQSTLSISGEKSAITWTSSDEKVATVVDGVVTGVAGGSATITAVSGEEVATCIVTVSGDPYVSTLNLYLNHTDFTLRANEIPVQMHVKVKETKKVYEGDVVWTSTDSQIASISENGLVEWVSKGTTTVTAFVDGQTLECIVRIK